MIQNFEATHSAELKDLHHAFLVKNCYAIANHDDRRGHHIVHQRHEKASEFMT